MQLFEHPYIFILVLFILLLGGGALCFLARGVKTTNEEEKIDFAKISRLEGCFIKSGKLRENRCVMYISVFMDSYRSLYSEERTEKVYAEIKQLLLQAFSPDQNGMIATYGDKAYVAYSTRHMDDVRSIVTDFQESLTKCLVANSAINIVDVKIGACYALGTEISLDDAIHRAKRACVLAKNNNLLYLEWDAGSGKALEKKIKMENNIENEIDNNRFFLVYQPILDAATKKMIGAEVLARLKFSGEGILPPGNFLSAVDSVGLNPKFDYYIFEKHCKWISDDKNRREGYQYTVNFSRATLCDPEFVEKILHIAEKYEVDSSCLAIEILEDKNVTDEARTRMMENLTALKEKGISVLLDDFGSGYTTFDDLQNLDISIVKIDRIITQNSVTETGYIILENIIRMAKSIGFQTLCEGVETKEQEEAAIRAGCDLLQGFYYYKPMPASLLENLIGEVSSDSATN